MAEYLVFQNSGLGGGRKVPLERLGVKCSRLQAKAPTLRLRNEFATLSPFLSLDKMDLTKKRQVKALLEGTMELVDNLESDLAQKSEKSIFNLNKTGTVAGVGGFFVALALVIPERVPLGHWLGSAGGVLVFGSVLSHLGYAAYDVLKSDFFGFVPQARRFLRNVAAHAGIEGEKSDKQYFVEVRN